jgi:hypothetical protein
MLKRRERIEIITSETTQGLQNAVNRFIDNLNQSNNVYEILDIQYVRDNIGKPSCMIRYSIP